MMRKKKCHSIKYEIKRTYEHSEMKRRRIIIMNGLNGNSWKMNSGQ